MKRTLLLKMLLGGFLAVALAAFFVLPAVPLKAHAASVSAPTNFCSVQPNDANCDGQQPEPQGCSADGIVTQSVNIVSAGQTLGQVQFVYSRTSLSAWARTVSNTSATLYAKITRSDGLSYSNTNSTVTKVHSAMIFASKPLRACGSINGVSACTP